MGPALDELRRRLDEHGYAEEIINNIIKQIEPFVGYGFNKSHAAAYAFIAYQTAYLKCLYPIEFYTALLTVFGSNSVKASNYIQDAKSNGYTVLPPDINKSIHEYSIASETEILYGFDSVKGLSKKAIDEIMSKRPFTDIGDLIERTVKGQLDKRAIRVLALSGALDSISQGMGNRMEVLQKLLMFRGDGDDISEDIQNFNKRVLLDYEKELLGVYVSGHPLEDISKPIDWEDALNTGERVVGHALLKDIRRILTKKNDPMAFFVLEFMEQDVNAVCFPHIFSQPYEFKKGDPTVPLGQLLKENMVVKIAGRYEEDQRGEPSFILDRISIPVRVNSDKVDEIQSLQKEIGTVQPIVEKIAAPSFSM